MERPGDIKTKLSPYLSQTGAWALALGTSIGWGSVVVTSSTYLSQAGLLGSVLGLLLGTAVMLIISRNYHYMMRCFPEAGGLYTYIKEAFGHDQAFLASWFLALTYLAIYWANVTSLPLFAKYFFGDIFRWGYLYTIFGYEVYLGQALLSIIGILIGTLLCMGRKKTVADLMVLLAVVFSIGIALCFFAAIAGYNGTRFSLEPAFVPDQRAWKQIVQIACISPWAFVGFENISHATEEFRFPRQKSFKILCIAVLSSAALYIFLLILSVTAYPQEYGSWLSYIRDLDNIGGIRGLPAFYAAEYYLGNWGIILLGSALLALIISSLIGNMLALSRLIYAVAKDGILPTRYARLNSRSVPANAMMLVAGFSVLIPFVGRTAIGWIVDVTTLGATLTYGFVSAAVVRMAGSRGDIRDRCCGMAGLILMILLGAFLLIPAMFGRGMMARESYVLFFAWAIFGFAFFRRTMKRDEAGHFGRSVFVWIGLLAMILFVALVWMSQTTMDTSENTLMEVWAYFTDGTVPSAEENLFMQQKLAVLRRAGTMSILLVLALFSAGVWILLSNYNLMSRRALASEKELGTVRILAKTDSLTGVKNKLAYQEYEMLLNGKIARGEAEPFALVVCDLNDLKHINDTYGHKVGDEFIRNGCRQICDQFLHSPVFRIGGDEFVALLMGADYAARAELMTEMDRRAIENCSRADAVVSAGLADYIQGQDVTLRSVFERADQQMYRKKRELKMRT